MLEELGEYKCIAKAIKVLHPLEDFWMEMSMTLEVSKDVTLDLSFRKTSE